MANTIECYSCGSDDANLQMFPLPILIKEQRKRWLIALSCVHEPDENVHVCEKHFVSKAPAITASDVDFVPTLDMQGETFVKWRVDHVLYMEHQSEADKGMIDWMALTFAKSTTFIVKLSELQANYKQYCVLENEWRVPPKLTQGLLRKHGFKTILHGRTHYLALEPIGLIKTQHPVIKSQAEPHSEQMQLDFCKHFLQTTYGRTSNAPLHQLTAHGAYLDYLMYCTAFRFRAIKEAAFMSEFRTCFTKAKSSGKFLHAMYLKAGSMPVREIAEKFLRNGYCVQSGPPITLDEIYKSYKSSIKTNPISSPVFRSILANVFPSSTQSAKPIFVLHIPLWHTVEIHGIQVKPVAEAAHQHNDSVVSKLPPNTLLAQSIALDHTVAVGLGIRKACSKSMLNLSDIAGDGDHTNILRSAISGLDLNLTNEAASELVRKRKLPNADTPKLPRKSICSKSMANLKDDEEAIRPTVNLYSSQLTKGMDRKAGLEKAAPSINGMFAVHIVSTTELGKFEKIDMKTKIVNNGGIFRDGFHTDTTILIVPKDVKKDNPKVLYAHDQEHMTVVNTNWVNDSIAAGAAKDFDKYAVKKSDSAPIKPNDN